MSFPLGNILEGDVYIQQGSDTSLFGYGDLSVSRRGIFNGTEDAVNATTATLVVYGGMGVVKSAFFHANLDVNGITSLDGTNIDTTEQATVISGANGVHIQVGSSSYITTTSGNLSFTASTGNVILQSGTSGSTAVSIIASHSSGGVSVVSGSNSSVSIVGGTDGIKLQSAGVIDVTGVGSGSVVLTSTTDAQDLLIKVANSGASFNDSSLILRSEGVGSDAVLVETTGTTGSVIVKTNTSGSGGVSVLTGAGGVEVATSAGPVSLTSNHQSTHITVNSDATGQNLVMSLQGTTGSQLVLESQGIDSTLGAISIQTLNTSGSIVIQTTRGSVDGIKMYAGNAGIVASTTTGPVSLTSNAAGSTFTVNSVADAQNLALEVRGTTNSSVVLYSEGTGADAVKVLATGGGMRFDALGAVVIESYDSTNGIQLATLTANVPVKIGTANSTTTIMGNLLVKGTQTTVDSATVKINDNIIETNSGPAGTADGGFTVKRYQPANNSGLGDVINDPASHSGTCSDAGSATTMVLGTTASTSDDFYNGWWVRIESGTGANQVRRIKDYTGATKTAIIYSTADQTSVLANVTPVEGLDFADSPDTTSVYSLYDGYHSAVFWNEATDEFSLAATDMSPDLQVSINRYLNLKIKNLTADTINNTTADVTFTVTLTNNSTSYIPMSGFPLSYGVYSMYVKPVSATNGSYAMFTMNRTGNASASGTVNRISSTPGVSSEQLQARWQSGNVIPELRFFPSPGGAGTTVYTVKLVSA